MLLFILFPFVELLLDSYISMPVNQFFFVPLNDSYSCGANKFQKSVSYIGILDTCGFVISGKSFGDAHMLRIAHKDAIFFYKFKFCFENLDL